MQSVTEWAQLNFGGLSYSGNSLGNTAGQKQVLAGDRFKQQVSGTSTFRAVPLAVSTVYESDYVVGKSRRELCICDRTRDIPRGYDTRLRF